MDNWLIGLKIKSINYIPQVWDRSTMRNIVMGGNHIVLDRLLTFFLYVIIQILFFIVKLHSNEQIEKCVILGNLFTRIITYTYVFAYKIGINWTIKKKTIITQLIWKYVIIEIKWKIITRVCYIMRYNCLLCIYKKQISLY